MELRYSLEIVKICRYCTCQIFLVPAAPQLDPWWALPIANLSPLDLRKDVQGKARTKSRKAH